MSVTFLTNIDREELEQEISALSGQNVDRANSLWAVLKKTAFAEALTDAELTAFKTTWGITDSGEEPEIPPVEPDEPEVPDTPEVTLSSITATYTGGDVTVGTALTDLTGITVTAHYSDGSTANLTGYTLTGTIAEGSNTITVSYGGKTTTFTVTGVVESGGEDEPTDDGTAWTDGVPYEYTLVANEYVGEAKNGNNGFKTYNGWSRTPFLPCKGVSSITYNMIDITTNLLTGAYGCWYDANKQYISYFAQTKANLQSPNIPSNACFVIFSQSDAVMNNIANITPHA